MRQIKIKHLSHSGFHVEDENSILLFDPITPLDFNIDGKYIYIFISHSHQDHFHWEVLEPLLGQEHIYFIASMDVAEKIGNDTMKNIYILDPYQECQINHVGISVYGTTDLGNSYLVNLNGKNYFHSGDLNWWHWKRMTPEERKVEEKIYKREVELLRGKSVDFAFVPVDPRLEEHGTLAANHFIQAVQPKYLIPMHSFGQYHYYKHLEERLLLHRTKLVHVDHEGHTIFIE